MTIRELAKLAGVSHATVSRALRDNPRLPKETRERIKLLAEKHGYTPHPMVSQLMSQLPHVRQIARSTIAIITRWSDWRKSNYLSTVHRGVTERAMRLGHKVEEFTLNSTDMTPARVSKVLYSRGIEGVLIYPFESVQTEFEMDWSRLSALAIGRPFLTPNVHRVIASYFDSMMLALHELQTLGYKRIALALTPVVRARVDDAYLAAYSLYERGIPAGSRIPIFKPTHAIPWSSEMQPVGEHTILHKDIRYDPVEVAKWLRLHRADALICNFIPTVDELREAGLRIPEEIGYVTLDSIRASAVVTGIDQQLDKLGAVAVDVLTSHMNRNEFGLPDFPKVVELVQQTDKDGS
jgi:LacI family transcriptional regulator